MHFVSNWPACNFVCFYLDKFTMTCYDRYTLPQYESFSSDSASSPGTVKIDVERMAEFTTLSVFIYELSIRCVS